MHAGREDSFSLNVDDVCCFEQCRHHQRERSRKRNYYFLILSSQGKTQFAFNYLHCYYVLKFNRNVLYSKLLPNIEQQQQPDTIPHNMNIRLMRRSLLIHQVSGMEPIDHSQRLAATYEIDSSIFGVEDIGNRNRLVNLAGRNRQALSQSESYSRQ